MKRYLIYSTKFSGHAELFYNSNGLLLRIDISKAQFPEHAAIDYFKAVTPVKDTYLIAAFEGYATSITEGEIVISFEQFWEKWGKCGGNKVNKKRCIPFYSKLPTSKTLAAFTGIEKYFAFCNKNHRKIQDPENYLKNETWENEYS